MARLTKLLIGTGVAAGAIFGVRALCKWLYAPGKTVTICVADAPQDFCDENPEEAKIPMEKVKTDEPEPTTEAKADTATEPTSASD